MKFSTTLLSALAPVALAKSVHQHFAKEKRTNVQVGTLNGLSGFGITQNALTEVIVIWVNPGAGAATTTINQQVTVTQTVTAGAGGETALPNLEASTTVAEGATGTIVGTGATHSITVGGPQGLVFFPDQISAAVGDMVVFTFFGQNHTATQSAFDTPCSPLEGGMDSGFQPNPDNTIEPAPQVAMQVMVDTPLWFYCKQGNHCGNGMAFSINPTAEKTHAMFQAMAIAQNGAGTPSAITGGEAAAPPAQAAPANGTAPADNTLAPLPGQETATAPGAATGTDSVVAGTGTVLPDGACACAIVVGTGAFPAVNAQGAGSFGGMPGALPATMAEAI